jgi:Uma2 family endonuclease
VPDLVVEILSPSTRGVDLGKKLARYELAGIPEYWVAEVDRPGVRVFVLVDGRYAEQEARDGRVASRVVPDLVVDIVALHEDAIWQDEW